MYTLSIMILSYLYFKNIFTAKISSSVFAADFLFQARPADRPGRPAPAQDMHACACLSADRPGRPTDCQQVCSRVFWVDRPVDRLQKLVFLLEDGRPEPNGYCQQGGQSTGRVDRQACKSPTALSSFVQF